MIISDLVDPKQYPYYMLTHQKELFDLEDNVTYLNGAYMSPQLKSVEKAGLQAILKKGRPYQITSEHFLDQRKVLREKFANLIEAEDYRNIAIIPSASYGIASVANNIKLRQGDEIVLVTEQFPSNVYVWKRLAEKSGATLRFVAPPNDFTDRGQRWNQEILKAINPKTAVVAMAHVHWADGTLFDLETIREVTLKHRALLIIDGTQSVGALPFSVKALQPDALICAGYKWLMGPYSLGVAYYNDTFNDGEPIEDNWLNRLKSEDFSKLTQYQDAYQPKAERYIMGESSNFVLVPMLIKAIEQLLEWNPENVQHYCHDISNDAIKELRSLGCFIEEDAHRAKHLFGVYLPTTMSMEDIKARLIAANIYVSYRGSAIRISPNVYNTAVDFEKLVSCFYP